MFNFETHNFDFKPLFSLILLFKIFSKNSRYFRKTISFLENRQQISFSSNISLSVFQKRVGGGVLADTHEPGSSPT